MEEKYIGHVNPETKQIQSLKAHLENVRYLAEKNCPLELFRHIVQVTALLHDAGKTKQDFRDYMKDAWRMENMQFAVRLTIRRQVDYL